MTDIDTEKAVLHEFLAYQRASVRAVLEGIDEDDLHRSVFPSGWTPLSMIEHLGHAERHWFQEVFVGSAEPTAWSDSDHPPVSTPGPLPEAFSFYAEQCRISDVIIASNPLTALPAIAHSHEPVASQTTDLRRIMLHMIEETARHAGHLDTARELIDGRTGLGPR
ncbi:uncharacterized protein DUF664 [Actinoplanes lutulentus]|uniref:Uncharacterized protein DUF664 n=1 Tax=Actinoplanes lutulentus TaxID=1287878 RepID=A0A327YZL7_9ACTN|nr:DinB family protein [Actinoplanes lutulentus]RAK25407.1 uncharacterized protein DUF664 [Actinoplanes lutulentus]